MCWWLSPAASPLAVAAKTCSSASVLFQDWEGVRYWSVSEGGWRTLITHATALEGPDLGRPRQDFTVAEMKGGSDLYFAQADNRASGDVLYRMQVRQAGPLRLVIAIENLSPVRQIPHSDFFEPGHLQSVHYLERKGPGLWSYYGLAWAGDNLPSVLQMSEASYVNRALALYRHFAGTHDPEAPP